MRVAVTVVVVALLAFVGYGAASRMLERGSDETARETPRGVADAWAEASADGALPLLRELLADRADPEQLEATYADLLPVLGPTLRAEVTDVTEDDNVATATLAWQATVGDGAPFGWTSELTLIRARGLWSVDWEPDALHPALRPHWTLAVEVAEASRAPVLDHLGRALSRTGATVEIGVQPGRLPERGRLLSTVGGVLPEAYDPLTDLLERTDLEDDWYYPLVTVSADRADEAWAELVALPGVLRRDAEAGVGAAVAAAEVVGAVALDDDGRRVGASGLEEVFDEQLTGSATTSVWLVDPDGGRRETVFTHQEDAAPPLVTTLDRDVQRAVDDAVLARTQPLAVVVLDPATAGVRAVASRPTTGYARALEGRYPPGAVAGVVTLTGAITLGTPLGNDLDCPASATVGGVRVTTRTAGPGPFTVQDALTGACDVALAELGITLGDDELRAAHALLGLDVDPQLPLDAYGWSWPATTSDAGHASAAIGHAQVQASTLWAAALAATVARGAPATPVLLADDVVTDGLTPLPTPVATGLRLAFRRAGELGPVQFGGVRVAAVSAATSAVRGDPAPTTGWWVGFTEGEGPDLAIAIAVEDDDGTVAADVAQRLLRELAGS